MGIGHRHTNVVVLGGVVSDAAIVEEGGPAGDKVRAWLLNEHEKHERMDIRIPLFGMGKTGERIMDLGFAEEQVIVEGSLTCLRADGKMHTELRVHKIRRVDHG